MYGRHVCTTCTVLPAHSLGALFSVGPCAENARSLACLVDYRRRAIMYFSSMVESPVPCIPYRSTYFSSTIGQTKDKSETLPILGRVSVRCFDTCLTEGAGTAEGLSPGL